MSGRCRSVVFALALAIVPPGAQAQSPLTDAARLVLTVQPEQKWYAVGEPVYVVAVLRNAGSVPITLARGLDFTPQGRHEDFLFTAVDEQGRQVRDPFLTLPNRIRGGRREIVLAPGFEASSRLLLNQWCRFEGPGIYRVVGRRIGPDVGAGPSAESRFEIELRSDDALARTTQDRLGSDFDTLLWLSHPSLESRFIESLSRRPSSGDVSALLDGLTLIDRRALLRGIQVLLARSDPAYTLPAGLVAADRDVYEAVPWLRHLLTDQRNRVVAMMALQRFGIGGLPETRELLSLFRTEDPALKVAVATALPYSKGERKAAKQALRDALDRDARPEVRLIVAAMLANDNDTRGIKAIVNDLATEEKRKGEHYYHYYYLERTTGLRLERRPDAWQEWFRRTGGRPPNAERRKQYLAAIESSDAHERLDGARLIGRLGREGRRTIPELRQMLSHADLWVRIGAAESLAWLGAEPESTVSAMVVLFADRNEIARTAGAIAAAFGRRGEPTLRNALRSPEPAVRLRAAEALGLSNAHDAASVDALARALEDASPDVRLYAAVAVGRLGRRAAAHAVTVARLLEEPSPPTRVVALEALGLIGNRRIVNQIRPLLNDDELLVREHASRALARLGAP
jgi:HEAT repeat protein